MWASPKHVSFTQLLYKFALLICQFYKCIVALPFQEAYQPELDDEFTPSRSFLTRAKKQNMSKSTRQDEDSQERQVINFNPNADMNEDSVREK